MRLVYLLLIAVCFTVGESHAFSQLNPCPSITENVSDGRFTPGQVWTYKTRPDEESSTLTILQIDLSEKIGTIIHVRVDGIKLHAPNGNIISSISHMPFTRDALLLSTEKLVRTVEIPSLEGYLRWKSVCGGVYTLSVRDVIAINEKTLNAR